MRTTPSLERSRRTSRIIRNGLVGIVALTLVAVGILTMGDSSSGLAGSAGANAMPTDAQPAAGLPLATEAPVLTEAPIATEAPVSTEPPVPTQPPAPVLPVEITDEKGVSMRLVPAGEFTMGGTVETALNECQSLFIGGTCESDWFLDEEPLHTVFLDDYYMDTYEVSNASYRECVNRGACPPPWHVDSETYQDYFNDPQYDNYPVVHVDWDMAGAYCAWRGARLPTEAEWEKAARGVGELIYPWGNSFDGTKANFCDSNCAQAGANGNYDDGYADTAPVDSYPGGVSLYGIFNLAGNVWEWVADWYWPGYYTDSPVSNPIGPASSNAEYGKGRVVRGGSWVDSGDVLRVTNRYRIRPAYYTSNLGIRCVFPPGGE